MKRKIACLLIIAGLVAAVSVLVPLARNYFDKPMLKHTVQGSGIVSAIERDFEIPVDPVAERPGVFSDNWLYWRGMDWNAGSRIMVCGIHDADTQSRIINLVEKEVRNKKLCDVEVVFYGNTKMEKGDRHVRRIEGPELRRVRIVGVTKSWRDQGD